MFKILASDVGEKMALGGITAALGVLVVFAVLSLLIGLVFVLSKSDLMTEAFKKGFKAIGKVFNKNKNPKPVDESPMPIAAPSTSVDNNAVAAAISAAIAMIYTQENVNSGKQTKFVVRSIKQIK